MPDYTLSGDNVNPIPLAERSVIPAAERARRDAFVAQAARRRRLGADVISARRLDFAGRIVWYKLDGPRSPLSFRPITVQARGANGQIRFPGAPYAFNGELRSIGAAYHGQWHVTVTTANAKRIASWLAWWDVVTDEAALELLRTAAAAPSGEGEVAA